MVSLVSDVQAVARPALLHSLMVTVGMENLANLLKAFCLSKKRLKSLRWLKGLILGEEKSSSRLALIRELVGENLSKMYLEYAGVLFFCHWLFLNVQNELQSPGPIISFEVVKAILSLFRLALARK